MSRLVAGINDRDPATVASLAVFPGEAPDTASARVAIEGFRHHLNGSVVRCDFAGRPEGWDNHLEYRLVSPSGESKSVVVYHDDVRNHTRVYDEFLGYFARAQRYATAVIEAVKARDAPRLARLLSPDDIDYAVTDAEQAIAAYAVRFDLPSLRIDYQGLSPGETTTYGPDVRRAFEYTVHGLKDGRPVSHNLRISHGDGLLGWRDSLVPDH